MTGPHPPTPRPPTPTGLGSWPGTDPLTACRQVFTELSGTGLPHLPELPARGPGSDIIGRGCALLVEMPVDLQPSGWRFTDRPGRDLERGRSHLGADTDALAEIADGYTGQVKLQVCGPWTLAGSVWLPRGERTLTDPGATRDLIQSLTAGVQEHLDRVRRLLPQATLAVQIDEPGLPAALAGRLPTASGFGRTRPVEATWAEDGLTRLVQAARDGGAALVAVHCCHARPPIGLLRRTGADALSLDTTGLDARAWESIAVAVEDGTRLWAGMLPTGGEVASTEAVDRLVTRWRRIGLPARRLTQVDPTPACGLAGAAPDTARRILHQLGECADALGEAAS